MTTVRRLRLQIFVKETLRRARLADCPPVKSLTVRAAAKELRVAHPQVLRWEDSAGGVPDGAALSRVVRWIERRLSIEAPE